MSLYKLLYLIQPLESSVKMVGAVGHDPTTFRLKAGCSAFELYSQFYYFFLRAAQ